MQVATRLPSIPAFQPRANLSADSSSASEKYMGSTPVETLGGALKGAAYYGGAALLGHCYNGRSGIGAAAGLGALVSFAEGTRVARDPSTGLGLAAANAIPTLLVASIGQHLGVGGVVACTVVGGAVGACLL